MDGEAADDTGATRVLGGPKVEGTRQLATSARAPACPGCGRQLTALADRCPWCETDLRPLTRAVEMADRYFNQAVEAAKAEMWDVAAEHLAVALALRPQDAGALVLLGKVRFLQGHHEAASAAWTGALSLSPGLEEAKLGIAKLEAAPPPAIQSEEAEKAPPEVSGHGMSPDLDVPEEAPSPDTQTIPEPTTDASRSQRLRRVAAVLVALVLICLQLLILGRLSDVKSKVTSGPRSTSQAEADRARQDELAQKVAELEGLLRTALADRANVLTTIAADIASPRVHVRTAGQQQLTVLFDGLFKEGDDLTPEGRDLLTTVGVKLRPYVDRVSTAIIGHTDDLSVAPGSRYRDNAQLGMARARAAAALVQATGALPADVSVVPRAAGAAPPFPGTAPGERARNRTIELTISLRRG